MCSPIDAIEMYRELQEGVERDSSVGKSSASHVEILGLNPSED